MKRLFSVAVAVVLCFVATVPAFAVDYDTIPAPDGLSDYVCINWVVCESAEEYKQYGDTCLVRFYSNDANASLFELRVRDDQDGYIDVTVQGPMFTVNDYYVDVVFFNGGNAGFRLTEHGDADFWSFPYSRVLDAGKPIYYMDSDAVFYSPGESDAILPGAIPSDSFSGVLMEVCSILVYVVPVLICFFGIRKGIAFLFARIRGV